jgi:hypothetical protein
MIEFLSLFFKKRKGRHTQIQTCLEQLRKERADLQAALEAKDTEINGTKEAQVVSSKKQCGDRLWIGCSPTTMLYHLQKSLGPTKMTMNLLQG